MKLWAIGDLHLSFDKEGNLSKPMGIFGKNWENHDLKIKENWGKNVSSEDLVLIPGDFSWGMNLEDIKQDIEYLNKLPGKKLLLRGNHDYWWTSSKKMKEFFPDNIKFIQNDHYQVNEELYVCGTRGWSVPGEKGFTPEDEKIYQRELSRLRLSLDSVPSHLNREIIVMLHYPPVNMQHEYSAFIDILKEYKVKTCIYAHLHDASIACRIPDSKWDIEFKLVSADALSFSPLIIKIIS